MSAMALTAAALACATLPGAWQVELLEDTRAELVSVSTPDVCVVPRTRLPAGAREGDVLVDGRVRPDARARLLQRVRKARALAHPLLPRAKGG